MKSATTVTIAHVKRLSVPCNKDEVHERREKTHLVHDLCICGGLISGQVTAKQSNLIAKTACFRWVLEG